MQKSTNNEIRYANLSNLQLAQKLLNDSFDAARLILGIGENEARFIADLNPSQLNKLSSSDCMLFSFRFKGANIEQLQQFISGDPLSLTHLHFVAARETLQESGVPA